jgi:hypothetical protein
MEASSTLLSDHETLAWLDRHGMKRSEGDPVES